MPVVAALSPSYMGPMVAAVRMIVEEFTRRQWTNKSLMQDNAESFYLRVKYHQIDQGSMPIHSQTQVRRRRDGCMPHARVTAA